MATLWIARISVWKCLEETSHSVLALAKKSQIEIISDIKILNISKSVTFLNYNNSEIFLRFTVIESSQDLRNILINNLL
ncbi:hypothetical protein Avbf_13215 [Armadillidium vulgare]|nr:hypothetical protein Avbf_13215 [Armadillidium vulgare]